MSRHETDDGAVEWREIDRLIHTPLDRIAADRPRLLRAVTDRIVHETAGRTRAVTTHFGSSN